jgi:AAA+ ATPase superfamily predicted ATPase
MMQGIALHASAPLFGRAKALFKISPLSPVWLTKAFSGTDETEAVRHFAAWGGMPRYWELAAEHGGTPESQLLDLVLDPQGPLNAEPDRLLHEETPTAVSLRPILDAIGLGAHKLSEIAGRIGMPATSLSPHLSRLIELEMVEREIPFGESEKSSKRSLYIISDPFLRFWFRIVAPNRSALSLGTTSLRLGILRKGFPALLGAAWEQLCRMAMPRLPLRDSGSQPDGGYWIGARRYWRGDGPEWDIVARSADGESLFLGECKWTDGPCSEADIQRWERELLGRGVPPVPEAAGKVSRALFVPVRPRGLKRTKGGTAIIDARELFRYL